jgi:SAM-dependent methyltransferase
MANTLWKRSPTAEELAALTPWLMVHEFGDIKTTVAEGAEGNAYFFSERVRLLRQILMPLAGISPHKTFFDLGCASGLFALEAAGMGWQAAGIDPREVHIQQANFLATLLADTLKKPEFSVGTDKTFAAAPQQWDVVACYGVISVLADPFALLRTFAAKTQQALIIEGAVYMPPNPPEIFTAGDNWTYSALCQLSNQGAIAHNKKGVDTYALVPSFPALVFGLFQAGFERVAWIPTPPEWATSDSRGLKRFNAGTNHLLVALQPGVAFLSPPDWVWLNCPPEMPNFNYHGILKTTAAPIAKPTAPSQASLRQRIGGKIAQMGKRIAGS